jgi:hypothetical protein
LTLDIKNPALPALAHPTYHLKPPSVRYCPVLPCTAPEPRLAHILWLLTFDIKTIDL